MALDYSKWDKLELSDDSDIEVHPNVDKKSFIRFKQRELHQRRAEARQRAAQWTAEIALNNVLEPRLSKMLSDIRAEGNAAFEREYARLRTAPSSDRPPQNASNPNKPGPSYDEMLINLFEQVKESIKEKETETKDLQKELLEQLGEHHRLLVARTKELEQLIKEQKEEEARHITSEDLHDGFNSSQISKNAKSAQPNAAAAEKQKKTAAKKNTEVEVLNPESSSSKQTTSSTTSTTSPSSATELTKQTPAQPQLPEDPEEVPSLTNSAKAFSIISENNWSASFKAISDDSSLLQDSVVDAILMAAFDAGMRKDVKTLRTNVHQALLLQYCGKLGPDGVSLFFKRMSNPQAKKVFVDDVNNTAARIASRSAQMAKERDEKQGGDDNDQEETIQLAAASDSNQKISFDVPEAAPPEHITIEGEGAENVDPEEVRQFLQERWDIFTAFDPKLQQALKQDSLDAVNKYLATLSVPDAEEVVHLLDKSRILNFSSSEIIDETKK